MHHIRGAARPRGFRAVLTATAVIACLALTAGCSDGGPKPEDQREEMVAATTAVIDRLVYITDAHDPAVLNDASVPVGCGNGEQYQYVAYTRTPYESGTDTNTRLNDLAGLIVGATGAVPGGPDYYYDLTELDLDLDGAGPRQFVFAVEEGPDTGATLSVDFVADGPGEILLRIAGATTCR